MFPPPGPSRLASGAWRAKDFYNPQVEWCATWVRVPDVPSCSAVDVNVTATNGAGSHSTVVGTITVIEANAPKLEALLEPVVRIATPAGAPLASLPAAFLIHNLVAKAAPESGTWSAITMTLSSASASVFDPASHGLAFDGRSGLLSLLTAPVTGANTCDCGDGTLTCACTGTGATILDAIGTNVTRDEHKVRNTLNFTITASNTAGVSAPVIFSLAIVDAPMDVLGGLRYDAISVVAGTKFVPIRPAYLHPAFMTENVKFTYAGKKSTPKVADVHVIAGAYALPSDHNHMSSSFVTLTVSPGLQISMSNYGRPEGNMIQFYTDHGRKAGDAIKYTQKTGAIIGLEDGSTYYVHTVHGTIKFTLAAYVGGSVHAPELVLSGNASTIGNTFTWSLDDKISGTWHGAHSTRPNFTGAITSATAGTMAFPDDSQTNAFTYSEDSAGYFLIIWSSSDAWAKIKEFPDDENEEGDEHADNYNVEWIDCAIENSQCSFSGSRVVRFGIGGKYFQQLHSDGVSCSQTVFGDPYPMIVKNCAVAKQNGEHRHHLNAGDTHGIFLNTTTGVVSGHVARPTLLVLTIVVEHIEPQQEMLSSSATLHLTILPSYTTRGAGSRTGFRAQEEPEAVTRERCVTQRNGEIGWTVLATDAYCSGGGRLCGMTQPRRSCSATANAEPDVPPTRRAIFIYGATTPTRRLTEGMQNILVLASAYAHRPPRSPTATEGTSTSTVWPPARTRTRPCSKRSPRGYPSRLLMRTANRQSGIVIAIR